MNIWKEEKDKERKVVIKTIWKSVLVVCVITLIFGSFYTINAGYRGVLLTFGKPSQEAIGEGLNFKIPIVQSIVKMDVKTKKYEATASAASKDLQIVTAGITLNYHIVPNTVPLLYQEVGVNYEDKIIQPLIQEVVKASTAQFAAEELITKRPEVKDVITVTLKDKLRERDIIVDDVLITEFDFSVTFNEAIEAKVTAEQLKLKADRDLQRIQIEAEQKIASAQAEAESLRLQKQEITPDLIALRQIEAQREAIAKWNGVLPTFTGGAIPFINVGDFN